MFDRQEAGNCSGGLLGTRDGVIWADYSGENASGYLHKIITLTFQ